MNDLYMMNQQVSRKIGCRLRKFCSPLIDSLEITHFYHYMLTDVGEFASVGLNQAWHDCLFSGRDGIFFLPDVHKMMENEQNRIIFTQAVENIHWQKLAKVATEEFNVNLGLQICIATDEGHEGFGFGLKTTDLFEHLAFHNKLPLINQFIHAYRREFENKFLKESLIDVVELSGSSFSSTPKSQKEPCKQRRVKNFCYEAPNPFTAREIEIVRHLKNGFTAPEIAGRLFRSKRTVEHHLERMKEKLDCSSKSELIQKVRKLETFGYKF